MRQLGTSSWIMAAREKNRVHAVVHEIDLAAAAQFLFDRGPDQFRIEMRHHGVDGQPILGRRLDHAHIADAQQRHVQRARNRRGAHGEHVHVLANLLEALLVAHAEALLFVDHQQPEVAELHILRKQPMRAHDDIHFARGDIFDSAVFNSFGATKRDSISMRTGNARSGGGMSRNAGTPARWWAPAQPPVCHRPAP